MSDSRTGRAPRTDAQWARQTNKRLRREESKLTVRVGSWVLTEIDGEVCLVKPDRQPVVLSAAPDSITIVNGLVHRSRTVSINGGPTGGSWPLIFRGDRTIDLDHDAPATDLVDALLALKPEYTTLDFTATGPDGGPYLVTTPAGDLRAVYTDLTGGTDVSITVE